MDSYKVLTDQDILLLLSMKDVVEAVELAFKAKAVDKLVSPPRFHIDVKSGSLVFTAGAETRESNVIGFRVYDSFETQSSHRSTNRRQLVAVFDSNTGDFKGAVIGSLVGAMRTGALGGVAVKHMSNPDAKNVGVLGSGFQARTQLEAVCAVRNIQLVKVFSPNLLHRQSYVREMMKKINITIVPVNTAKEAVLDSDILLCATSSDIPVFDESWLKKGVHINTIGPKLKGVHEISVGTASRSKIIATDSLSQLNAYAPPYFLAGTPESKRITELSEIVVGRKKGRDSSSDITLFLSVGLAGTEVLVANAAIEKSTVKRGK